MPSPSARGRKDRAPLSRPEILRAALAVMEREGLEALSMRRLGAELGVEAMSIYRHVPNKAAVLDGLHELILSELAMPPDNASPLDWLEEAARAFRRVLLAHPQALPLFATRPVVAAGSIAQIERVLAVLHRAGLAPATAVSVLKTITSFVIGQALAEAGLPASGDELVPREAIQQLPAEAFPEVHRALQALTSVAFDEAFEFGLAVILAGLEQRVFRNEPGLGVTGA